MNTILNRIEAGFDWLGEHSEWVVPALGGMAIAVAIGALAILGHLPIIE